MPKKKYEPSEDQEQIIQKYTLYLQSKKYKKHTITSYQSKLRLYVCEHHIQDIQNLQKIIKKDRKNVPPQVYNWLNIFPPRVQRTSTHEPYDMLRNSLLKNDKLVIQFQKERGIKNSTMAGYISSIQYYLQLIGFSDTEEMIHEALEDEKNRIPIKESRINKHLRKYLRYLRESPAIKTNHTINTYFSKIESFYRHFNVTIPHRTPISTKPEYVTRYEDLPNKTLIEQAINQSDIELQSLIYFMSSSGTAKAETLSITVGLFIDSLQEYVESTDPKQVIEKLKNRKDLVPIIPLLRRKTNIPYYTCCSPEATHSILQYMSKYGKYERKDSLWSFNENTISNIFARINDKNGWGRVGPYRRFRTHMLRKFHASNIGCSFEEINMLEGRTNGTIHETYVKQKPDQLKKVYMEHMSNVMIHPENFIGPHCGGEREEEKIKNSIKELVPDLVPTLEHVQQQAQVVQPSMVQQAPFDYNILKDIARLETRMDAIEQRLEKLGG